MPMPDKISPPPVNFQAGSGTTDANGDATITFPQPFGSTPKVFLQSTDAAAKGIVLDVVAKSATQFTVKARRVTGLPTGQALKDFHYSTASAVTGIPSATGSALGYHSHTVSSHSHSYSGTTGGPSTQTPVVDGLYITPVASASHTHDGTTGGPFTTVAVASSDHKHKVAHIVASTSWTDPPARDDYDFYYSDGSACHHVYTGSSAVGVVGDLYTLTPTRTVTVASSTHTHDFTTGAPGGTTPTTDVAYDLHACYVASSDHTHSFSGTTGSASPGTSSVNLAHTHSIGAPSTATFVSAVGILPEDWITVVTGDAPVAEVEFDWLAILP